MMKLQILLHLNYKLYITDINYFENFECSSFVTILRPNIHSLLLEPIRSTKKVFDWV